MFLFEYLLILSAIYWCSFLIAGLILISPEERRTPPIVRIGLGYLFSVVWFSAAFKLFDTVWSWGLGLFLLTAYIITKPRKEITRLFRDLQTEIKLYMLPFGLYLLLGLVFLLPLHLSANYGPFSEGGGDSTIYADVSRHLADHRLAAFGPADVLNDLSDFWTNFSPGFNDNKNSMATFSETMGNPPIGNYQEYRIVTLQKWPSSWFVPTAQWSFFSRLSNYPEYFSILGFQYGCIILSIWTLFRRYGLSAAILASGLALSSHGLITVFYNHYYPQSVAITVFALFLGSLSTINLISWSGFRSYFLGFILVLTGHLYYISALLGPLLFMAIKRFKLQRLTDATNWNLAVSDDASTMREEITNNCFVRTTVNTYLQKTVLFLFTCLIFLWTFIDSWGNLGFYVPFIKNIWSWFSQTDAIGKNLLTYLGQPIPLFSHKWLSFFYGLLSQQHFEPYMPVLPEVKTLLSFGIFFGTLVLLSSLFLSLILVRKLRDHTIPDLDTRRRIKTALILYFVCLCTVGCHHLLAQSSLYTQAKGAQNVLPALYTAMILPFGAALLSFREKKVHGWIGFMVKGYGVVICLFALFLLLLRLIYALFIAYGIGRSSILEDSYFSEAIRILNEDPQAFVLMEPRNSVDTYLGNQPFSHAKIVPTRFLAMQTVKNVYAQERWIGLQTQGSHLSSDFISSNDLEHLWYLKAHPVGSKELYKGIKCAKYVWKAERLKNLAKPRLLFFGDHYDAFHVEKSRSAYAEDKGWFSYFRNGSVMIIIPGSGEERILEVVAYPENVNNFGVMIKDVKEQLKQVSCRWTMETDPDNARMTIQYELPRTNNIQLVLLIRYWGEFWFNARIDGSEFYTIAPDTPGNVIGNESKWKGKITANKNAVSPGESLPLEWSGVDPVYTDDWVGLFPVGGRDQSRILFFFTGGGVKGSRSITIPFTIKSGTYELRFFSHGGWKQGASSQPFQITNSDLNREKVSGTIRPLKKSIQHGESLVVSWKGVMPAHSNDWIGIFPLGGGDKSRVLFAFTGGASTGTLSFLIPPTVLPGKYEFRMYTQGTWQKILSSDTFIVVK